jgi:hypothetical protein
MAASETCLEADATWSKRISCTCADAARARVIPDLPLLVTTTESLEVMLTSSRIDHQRHHRLDIAPAPQQV